MGAPMYGDKHPRSASDIGVTRSRKEAALDVAREGLREIVRRPTCPESTKFHARLTLDRIDEILGKAQT